METNNGQIILYGNSWCYDSRKARKFFDQNNIAYTFVDIDSDMDGRRYVEKVNNGNRSVPTILFPDGTVLIEPSSEKLKAKLGIEDAPAA